MAFDGATLYIIKKQIEGELLGARVDKIHQPSREELVIQTRGKGQNRKLYLSVRASSPRIHFTEQQIENPKVPPMFCMLLRKYLTSARLQGVRQLGLDRVLFLDFETQNELGDQVCLTLAVEIMGRHSNIILVDEAGKVIDAIKRVGEDMSSVRQVLPGMAYTVPPTQDKCDFLKEGVETSLEKILSGRDAPLSKAVLGALQGLSPIVAREISHYATRGRDTLLSALSEEERDRLRFFLGELKSRFATDAFVPTTVLDERQKPKDFTFFPVAQYGNLCVTRESEDMSTLLDGFYARRDVMDRIHQRSSDLLRLLTNASERITRKLQLQREELANCADRERIKNYGDLISANLYQIEKGQAVVLLTDFYDPEGAKVEVRLDPSLTPVQNAQRYYHEYKKTFRAEQMLTKEVEKGEEELAYLDSVLDQLTRAETEQDLMEIRRELHEQGYARAGKGRQKVSDKVEYLQYQTSDGFWVRAGRNNRQNDRLTLKESRNYDLWLHAHNMPGSHVVIVSDGKEITPTAIEEAANIAALHSKGREMGKTPVDYTLIRNVKKHPCGKPGMVNYVDYQTIYVTPDEKLENFLKK